MAFYTETLLLQKGHFFPAKEGVNSRNKKVPFLKGTFFQQKRALIQEIFF
jgi:hypothetical protein